MRAFFVLAFVLCTTACSSVDTKTAMATQGNGGCYLGKGVYSGARCPGQHP